MELKRRSLLVYLFLAAFLALVGSWQAEEHFRVQQAAKADLKNRSKDIANTVSACIRGMRWRGAVLQDKLDPLLDELVNGRAAELVQSSEVLSIALLNAAGEKLASAGRPIDLDTHQDILQQGEHWGQNTVTFVNPVDLGARLTDEGATNPTVVLPSMRSRTNAFPEGGRGRPPFAPRREPGSELGPPPPDFPRPGPENLSAAPTNGFPRPEREGRSSRDGEFRSRRPPWMRGMSDPEYQALMEKRALHGLVLAMSTEPFQAACARDLWLRYLIMALATAAVIGSGLAWRNLSKSSELEIRLVRASELNTHLKELSVAAAGLAHETRNPLNIIRGRAQMISKQPDTVPETRQKACEIIDQADKVAAQLNEFINYSRPREVRRSRLALGAVVSEVVRTLSYDLEEKQVVLEIKDEQLSVEADEQLLRQALFNLLLNAIQAVELRGQIQVIARRANAAEAFLEVRDSGPGVPPERRAEVFKPYFTTQAKGTGLGLAVVQQIVLAHGWEIHCLANEPKGALFRISHLKLAS